MKNFLLISVASIIAFSVQSQISRNKVILEIGTATW